VDYCYKDGNDIDESELKRFGWWGIDPSFDMACKSPGKTYLLGPYWCELGFGWMDH
jgi:hypothetical protein